MTAWMTVATVLLASTSGQVNWPGFRGTGDGITPAKHLPLTWSAKDNIAWKVELPGYGQSSPVVWGDKVFVTAVSGAQREKGFVIALNALSGKKLWEHELAPTQKAKWSNMISRAAPTPVVDDDAVYALFEGGNLLAVDHAGKLLWSRALFKEYGDFENNHGLGSSLAQTADAVIALIDHKGPSYLLAVDKKTGKNKWKTERESRGSWTSPVVTQDGKQIIVSSNGSVAGYDAAGGTLLWEKKGLAGNTVPSASVNGDVVLVGAGAGRGGESKQASNLCLKLTAKGYETCWEAEKVRSSFATPLAYRGHAYFINQQGAVHCVDLATGKEQYAERIDHSCWASPLGVGEHVYFFGKDGTTTVIKSGPKFEVVAVNPLWQGGKKTTAAKEGGYSSATTLYGVAAVDGAFFVRTGTSLYRIADKTK